MYSKGGAMIGTANAAKGAALAVLIFVGAIAVGFAIPLGWLWIGAKLQGTSGVTHMTKTTAIAMFPGIAISYVLLLRLVSGVRAHLVGEAAAALPPRRYSWNRSRDEQIETEPATPMEKLFITAAVIVTLAFEVWFFLFAGPPI
jgi:hypothetical protein